MSISLIKFAVSSNILTLDEQIFPIVLSKAKKPENDGKREREQRIINSQDDKKKRFGFLPKRFCLMCHYILVIVPND